MNARNRRVRPARPPVPPDVRMSVFARDNHQCRCCRRSAPHVRLTIDHVVPRCRGGTNDPTNLQLLCWKCNHNKADK